MKKRSAAIAALGAAAAVIWAAVVLIQPNKPYIPPKPQDTALEFWICDDGSQVDWREHDEIGGWMGAREFLGKDYHAGEQGERPPVRVSYLLTAWPDYADGGNYITTIEVTDPAVSVYGLTVESGPAEFERVMTSVGYEVEWVTDSLQRAVRDGFTFSIYRGDAPAFCISAQVGNRKGIVF